MVISGKKVALAACSVLLMFLLSGCGEPQEPAANQINRLVESDQEIGKSLKELIRYEKEDMALYKSILSNGKNKNSDIEALLDHLDERLALVAFGERDHQSPP